MILDLFAGPGGWSEGLRMLGHSEIGVEWDEAACKTAEAAGHRRVQADVAKLSPEAFTSQMAGWDGCTVDGLIASPPCQAWSMAGKGGGRRDVEHVVACAIEIAAGNDTRAEHAAKCEDERSMLVVEPLRWALALCPKWIAMEQVPPVLELWTLFAQLLGGHGYNCWVGVLEAERYGVPQTRERAILMAHRERPVQPPRATHQRYVPGEPQRHDITFDGEVLPWVSMAEALGWDDGRAYRLARGEGMLERHGERRAVPKNEPAPVVTSKARTAEWVPSHYDCRQTGARPRPVDEPAPAQASQGHMKGRDVWLRANAQKNAAVRAADEPAPTIIGGHSTGERVWLAKRDDRPERKEQGAGNQPRPVDAPATTIDSGLRQAKWTTEQPSTTVAADPRIFPPGHFHRDDKGTNKTGAGVNGHPIRVTVQEASILQSFRPDYPWQGSRSKQFEQIGNAVPPLLAKAVLSQLVEPANEIKEAA